MNDYSSFQERDQFNEKICDLVEAYIENDEVFPEDVVLAIKNDTYELKICLVSEIDKSWDVYQISQLIRENEEGNGKEANIDITFDIANNYFFVK